MIRNTSIEVYNEIKENGLLGGLQFEVYNVLFQKGPLTQNELHRHYFANTQPRNIQPRVSELVNMGAVETVGERPCSITGRICLAWDVTKNIPIRPPKKKSLALIIAELREQIVQKDVTIRRLELKIEQALAVIKSTGQLPLI